jgi:hypothetical protein
MKTLKPLLHAGKILVLALVGWLLSTGILFAKEGTTSESSGGGSWVFAYFLTGLAVVLGMLVICRSSTRRDRIRPEAYTEGKVGHAKEE